MHVHRLFSTQPPFVPSSKICEPATPASNAFLDLDGDCLSDIFLMCKSKYSNDRSFQIWKNREQAGFVFAGEWALPSGAGAISFADMGGSFCRMIRKLCFATDGADH